MSIQCYLLFIDAVWGAEVGSTVLKGGTKRRFENTKGDCAAGPASKREAGGSVTSLSTLEPLRPQSYTQQNVFFLKSNKVSFLAFFKQFNRKQQEQLWCLCLVSRASRRHSLLENLFNLFFSSCHICSHTVSICKTGPTVPEGDRKGLCVWLPQTQQVAAWPGCGV